VENAWQLTQSKLYDNSRGSTIKTNDLIKLSLYKKYTTQIKLAQHADIQRSVLRFPIVELMPSVLVPLVAYLHTQFGRCTGISFIDSTSLAVCRNPRIHQHRV
jgi:hypothetical protein